MIVVFPQARERWVTPRMERLALATLERSASEFRGDATERISWDIPLAGPARGGLHICTRIASQRSLQSPAPCGLLPDSFVHRSSSPICARTHICALAIRSLRWLRACAISPLASINGSADKIVSPIESRSIVAALRSLSNDVRFAEFSGVNHADVLTKVLDDDSLGAWLLAQRRRGLGASDAGAPAHPAPRSERHAQRAKVKHFETS